MKKVRKPKVKVLKKKRDSLDTSKNRYIAIAVTLVATFVSFFPSLNNSIDIWDDQFYIINNDLIKNLSWEGIRNIFAFTPVVGNYHPLTVLSYAIEYHFFGLNPFIYHFDNILLHLMNTLLVFVFINKLSSRLMVAFIASMLFGIHPLHVESVTWVSERKDVLYALFFLLALVSWMNYTLRRNKKYYTLAIVFFILSCLSKGMAVTFSIIIILVDYLLAKKLSYKILIDKIPFLIISLVFGLIAIKVQADSEAVGFTSNEVYTLSDRFFFANYSFFFYINKMLFPVNLSGLYPYPVKSGDPLPFIYYFSFPANVVLIFLMFYSLKKTKKVLFGGLFFIVSIFPVLQILSVGAAIAADRYFYISSIGLFYLAGVGFDNLYHNKSKSYIRPLITTFSVIVIIILCVLTFERTKVWKTRGDFWGDVAEKYPKLELPYLNRAIYYSSIDNDEKALADLNKALSIHPGYMDALRQRYIIFINKGNYQEALTDLKQIIEIDPQNTVAYYMMGEVYGKHLQDTDNALKYLNKAYELSPGDFQIISSLAIVYAMRGDFDNAIEFFNLALEIEPDNVTLLSNLSLFYTNIGNTEKAEEFRQKAELAKQLAK